jgi:hypothetical protein
LKECHQCDNGYDQDGELLPDHEENEEFEEDEEDDD